MSYIKKEFKKLAGMSLVIVGSFLILEHIYTYGSISLLDFFGHEWFGIILIVIGLIIANKKWSEKLSPIKYALNKLK